MPTISNAPKDHHSLLQLYLDGPKNKLFYIFSHDESSKEKINSYNRKAYHSLTPEEKKKRNRAQQVSLYGLTLEQYNAMLTEQKGVCAICKNANQHNIGTYLHIMSLAIIVICRKKKIRHLLKKPGL